MRLLYLVTDFNLTGGKERYNKTLIQLLRKKNFVCVVMLKNTSFFSKIWFVAQIFFWCLIKKWDIIFCAHVPFSPICLILGYVFKIKYLVIAHGIEAWDIKNRFERLALRMSKAIIAVSNFTKEKIISQFPEMRNRILLLSNSIDGNSFYITEKPLSLVSKYQLGDEKVILTVSRLYPAEKEKGYYRIIDALPTIIKTIPNVRYIIVGGGSSSFGDAREYIQSYAEEKGVAKYLILSGKVTHKELVEYYNLCDIFVMPSKQEGCGIVFLEALACGKPVIVGNQDASREAILNGELGLIVNPDNTEEIAEVIIKILLHKAPKHFFNQEFLRHSILTEYGIDKLEINIDQLIEKISELA